MTLTSYINDLLYRYDCVIVPNFGGFVTNVISAKINESSHTFYPPTKQVTFNSHLKNNDGLLANYIATSENISFEQAIRKIEITVKNWTIQLQKEAILVGNIGSLVQNKESQLIFEPNTNSNYLTATFGMSPLTSAKIQRVTLKEQAKVLAPVVVHKKSNAFIKYAATAAVLLTLGAFGRKAYQNNQLQENYAKQQKKIEDKIQSATFVISNPLPTIQLNVTKEQPKNYHVVAGAFEFKENAEKKQQQLNAKGFNAQIIGVNNHGLTLVTYGSYTTRDEAYKNLAKIKKTVSKDAWHLFKKQN